MVIDKFCNVYNKLWLLANTQQSTCGMYIADKCNPI